MAIGTSKIGALGGLASGGSTTFNSPGTFVVPPGIRTLSVVEGTGGSGNPGNAGNAGNPGNDGGGGGGGGAQVGRPGIPNLAFNSPTTFTMFNVPYNYALTPIANYPDPTLANAWTFQGPTHPTPNRSRGVGGRGGGAQVNTGTPGWVGSSTAGGGSGGTGVTGSAGSAGTSGNPGNAGTTTSAFCFNFAGGCGGTGGNGGSAGNGGTGGGGGTGGPKRVKEQLAVLEDQLVEVLVQPLRDFLITFFLMVFPLELKQEEVEAELALVMLEPLQLSIAQDLILVLETEVILEQLVIQGEELVV